MNEYTYQELYLEMNVSFTTEITKDSFSQFLSLSGDSNPLHSDDLYAEAIKYPRKVFFGMGTASLYSTLVGVYLPGKFNLLQEIDIQFKAPVFEHDHLTVYGKIVELQPLFKRVIIKSHITNQNGVKISTSKITCGVLK
ncbi:MAG: MaoC family dehydratase N-terminal domain-containing protein [Oligoflexia bacterium]|nr:MaoC family dehydratase N-terminal domain-containing protein [Oligoflexia bacterium]